MKYNGGGIVAKLVGKMATIQWRIVSVAASEPSKCLTGDIMARMSGVMT